MKTLFYIDYEGRIAWLCESSTEEEYGLADGKIKWMSDVYLIHHYRSTSNTCRATSRDRKGETPVGYEFAGNR